MMVYTPLWARAGAFLVSEQSSNSATVRYQTVARLAHLKQPVGAELGLRINPFAIDQWARTSTFGKASIRFHSEVSGVIWQTKANTLVLGRVCGFAPPQWNRD